MLLWTAALDSFAMQLPLCRWRCQRGFANAGKGNHDLSDDPTISCLESFTLHTFRRPEHGNIQYADQWASVYWWTGLPSVEVWQWSVVASTALSNVASERDALGVHLHCSSDKPTICSQTRFCVSWLLSAGIWWAIARSLIYFRYNFFSLLCSDNFLSLGNNMFLLVHYSLLEQQMKCEK